MKETNWKETEHLLIQISNKLEKLKKLTNYKPNTTTTENK
jgi:hypothetical protein